MRPENLYVASVASWLPAALRLSDAVRWGECPPEVAAESGIQAVTVSTEAPPFLASRAARLAIERAGRGTGPVSLLLYATISYQGHDEWHAPSFIQRTAVGVHNPSLISEIRQMADGGLAALELAAAYVSAGAADTALVVAADRFSPPGYDRWRSDPGTPLGDGGGALLLSRRAGFARLRCVVSWSDPELEGMDRGDDLFGVVPFATRRSVDKVTARTAFAARLGDDNIERLLREGHRSVVRWALDEAGVMLDEIDWFVLPHRGWAELEERYLKPLAISVERTTWQYGRQVGHLGAADQFVGFDALASSGRLRPGDLCLLLGTGGGYTWTCACVEVLERPGWLSAAEPPESS
jgi:3-oxoacyl-[acyl-carrier-protein] synthase-3